MPWCTKCKLEYVEGVTVCPDCGSPLVDNKDSVNNNDCLVFKGEEDLAERIAQFLDYSEIKSVHAGEPDSEGYPVLVAEQDYKEALKLARIFLYKETEQNILTEEEQQEQKKQQEKAPAPYIKKADKYEDTHSSAVTLLVIGSFGIIFMVLKIAGVLPFLSGSASLLFDLVMSAVFLFFLICGFSSQKRAKQLKGEIAEEVSTTKEITEWFLSAYTGETIDAAISLETDMAEEMKYFHRTEFIKQELNTKLTELDDSYLEDLTENLYHTLFE